MGLTGAPDLWTVYEHAASEVRAQVQLNEARAARLSTFTALILAAGVGLRDSPGAALVFMLGACCAVFSALAVATGHGYYRALRDHMIRLADVVDVEVGYPATPRATPGQRSGRRRRRRVRVQTAQHLLFATMAVVGVVGAVSILFRTS